MEWGPKGVVTWESAKPLRDALKTRLPRIFANCYVIGVDGIPLGDARERGLCEAVHSWLEQRQDQVESSAVGGARTDPQ